MEFVLPLKLEHLQEQPSDHKYWVQELVSVAGWDAKRQAKQLEKLTKELFSSQEYAFEIPKYFDLLYSFVVQIESLTTDNQQELVNILTAAFNEEVTASEKLDASSLADTKECFSMHFLLIYGVFVKCKTFVSRKSLVLINKALVLAKKLYLPDKPETRFVEMVIEIVFSEIERGQDDELCEIMKWVKDLDRSEVWEGWRAKAVNVLFGESEKCVKPIVAIVKSDPSLVNELLSCIGDAVLANNQVNETQGIKNVGVFIEKLTSKLPREMLMNVSVIVSLLNCEAFSLRNCIVTSIGEILVFIIKKDMEQSAERDTYTNYREQLLNILKSRVMDKVGFCRARVLEAFHTLNKEELLPRDWFLPVLDIASKRLLDSTVLVRRKATTLLENLIYTNKLLEGEIKVEPQENIANQIEKRKEYLQKLELALDGQFDENPEFTDKEEIQQQIIKTQILLKFLESYYEMTRIFQNSVKILLELLKSKNSSDIEGAIDVLVACNIRGVSETNEVVSAMLSLVCNSEPKVRKKVLDAFHNIYLNKKLSSEESSVQRMFSMIESLNIGQLSSLESLFAELFTAQIVPSEIKKRIWNRFKTEESYGAACILRFMAVSSDKGFLERRYDAFASRALALSDNWQIFRECLLAFQHLDNQGEKTDQFVYKAVHQLFNINDSGWFAVAEQLVRTAAVVCERPLLVLKAMSIKALTILLEGNNREFDVAKAVFIGGEVAMKVVVHGEKVASEYKKSIDTSKTNDELDEINGGRAAQVALELKALKADQENIVFEGLISKFTPIVLGFVKKLDEVKTMVLRKALVLSLAKFMCINSKLCEQYLPQLLRIAQENEDEGIRSTAVISLGDLVMRHPNLLEKQSGHLFSLLSDDCIQVRKKALLIISHLVLNDMLKMKGLMSNIMRCYLDPELKGVVCVFIEELHTKDANAIYNMIPDSISNLLKTPNLTHNEFKNIADMIFTYITKERQGENLSEKLSMKFKDSAKEECLNIGYCLSKLPWNEKAMKKLMDNVSWWQNKILDDQMLGGYFMDIATKCKKTWKNESKALIDEFEAAMRGEEEVVKKRRGRVQ